MRVLVITGDKSFGPGHPRYELQASAAELVVMYWGQGSMFPRIPGGHVDVVTVQDAFWRGLFAWHVARKLHARFNVQVHTDLSAQPFVRRMLAQHVLMHADSVRVVSAQIKEQVGRVAPQANVTVLPVFVDVEKYKAIVRRPEPGLVLWVGRFEVEKDPLYALEVIKQVPGARLILLGKGSLGPALRAAAKGMPVEFAGWQDPAPYLARAAAVLSTSRHESWGQSVVEALAAGVPVVGPDVGVFKEAGATVVPHSELAGALTEVLRNGTPGRLQLQLPSAAEWAARWQHSLQ